MAGRHPLQQEQQQLAQLQQRLRPHSWVCQPWLYLLQLHLQQQLQAMLRLAGKLGVCGALQHCSSSSKRQLPVLQARPDRCSTNGSPRLLQRCRHCHGPVVSTVALLQQQQQQQQRILLVVTAMGHQEPQPGVFKHSRASMKHNSSSSSKRRSRTSNSSSSRVAAAGCRSLVGEAPHQQMPSSNSSSSSRIAASTVCCRTAAATATAGNQVHLAGGHWPLLQQL
jgi:hypothetical protein